MHRTISAEVVWIKGNKMLNDEISFCTHLFLRRLETRRKFSTFRERLINYCLMKHENAIHAAGIGYNKAPS